MIECPPNSVIRPKEGRRGDRRDHKKGSYERSVATGHERGDRGLLTRPLQPVDPSGGDQPDRRLGDGVVGVLPVAGVLTTRDATQ